MIRNWRKVLCSVCVAMMLTACGTTEEEIQIVEQEDIVAPLPSEGDSMEAAEKIEVSGEAEQPVPEENQPAEGETVGTTGGKPAAVTIETETQEYRDGDTLLMTANYDHVTVSVEGNEAATRTITEVFEKREQEFKRSVAELVEDAKEDTIVTDSGMSYIQGQGYQTQRNDGSILSFAFLMEEFLGGAHGYYMEYGLNFDAETGQVLTVEDIAQDVDAFQEISVQEMLRQSEDLRAQGALFEEEMIPGGLQGIFEGKMEGDEWYFTADGIRFISNIYEIAPYAAGNFAFDIPYEMINDVLKEEYRG